MKTHSPGPWRSLYLITDEQVIGDAQGHTLFSANPHRDGFSINAADWALVTAAPELLAALKALVAETERCDNARDMGVNEYDDVMDQARAVIAKAEGQRRPAE